MTTGSPTSEVVETPCPFQHEVKRGPFLEIDTEDFFFVRVSCADCGCAGPYVPFQGDRPTKTEKAEAVRLWGASAATLLQSLEARIEELTRDGERYMHSVKAVFAIDPRTKKCFAEGSPTKDQETYERFIEFNEAGKAFAAALTPSNRDRM